MDTRRTDAKPYDVCRVPVPPDPLVPGEYSYADTFELRLAHPDSHSAQEWVRAALEQASPAVRGLIHFVHGRVARFTLSAEEDSVLGWRVLSSTPEAFHIATQGPGLRAEIVARRTSPTTAALTTFLFYKGHRTGLLWLVVGPLHRRVVPYLLARAASHLTRADSAA